ncbi:DUF2515 domain-containing protein [Paenibacillus antri]|uniref:DUF2515 domain-containing protein n=1 Tax=Paenibacillus antri TaxID=2582848 RepID=A0A5R9GIS9_9BACL|nr:DUF2515 family protein [Paenibacillus antri]TLS53364.1 DUF2515 domain-containing protein [Paenibacillus antri]
MRTREEALWKTLLRRMTAWFGAGAAETESGSPAAHAADAVIRVDPKERERVRRALERPPATTTLDGEAARLVERIRNETRERNRDNVTRTNAYREFYIRRPEVHWAFLAHMVSRNGGWNMTDLQGELLPRLLATATRGRLFDMLEDANSFIFGDAFPQLLLYEECRKRGVPRFSLLPALGVSRFMQPVWERFWETRDSALLTTALIVNEQHYIEGRIVRDPKVQEQVLSSLPFQAQAALQLNQVYFPYGGRDGEGRQRLAGLILENFGDLAERIEVGKTLYAMLFGIQAVADGAEAFASKTPHTGSRADYWPELFAPLRARPPGGAYEARLDGPKLRPGAERFYSPRLEAAWKRRPLREPERYDWLRDAGEACAYLTDARAKPPFEMGAEACYGLNKLELAALANAALR